MTIFSDIVTGCRDRLPDFPDRLVLLMPGIEKTGRKRIESPLGSNGTGQGEPGLIAIATARMILIVRNAHIVHCADPARHIIYVVLPDHGQIQPGGNLFHGLAPPEILGNGMNIGIGEIAGHLIPLFPQGFDAHDAAWSTAGVEQNFLHDCFPPFFSGTGSKAGEMPSILISMRA